MRPPSLSSLSSLSMQAVSERLSGPGLYLTTGQFQLCIRSPVPVLASTLALLYADYPLAPADGFTDFHVTLNRAGGLRRLFRPQVIFEYDGALPFKPLPQDQAFPMMEWGLNWCVSNSAHSYFIIHAAVIEKDGRAAILPAPPGSGKSTLCAALIQRGWRLLSDELTLVRIEDGRLVPLPRPVSLKNASIDIIHAYEPSAVTSRKVFDTVKGTIAHLRPPTDSVLRAAEEAAPAWIVFPKYAAGAATSLAPIPPARAFMRVAENSFNYSELGRDGFDTVARLIDGCDSYDFTYSVLDEAIDAFSALPVRGAPR